MKLLTQSWTSVGSSFVGGGKRGEGWRSREANTFLRARRSLGKKMLGIDCPLCHRETWYRCYQKSQNMFLAPTNVVLAQTSAVAAVVLFPVLGDPHFFFSSFDAAQSSVISADRCP